ncbi:hypothetical protein [Streptomyces sp. NPDC102462]|uniref:hypothetical protein n=1 Tax=Streptomyces sp. NPDC102462 TaxID=3366178 RepID=UPI00382DB456
MIEYELHLIRATELRRRAEHERLVREALRQRRAARRAPAARRRAGRESPSDTGHPGRHRHPRTA